MNSKSELLSLFGDGVFTWILSKLLDKGLDWLKTKKFNNIDDFTIIVENVIERNPEISLSKQIFIELLSDNEVKRSFLEFEAGEKEIDLGVLVKSLKSILFKEAEDSENLSNKIISDLLEEIRFRIFSDQEYTNRFYYSLHRIFQQNQTEYSIRIILKLDDLKSFISDELIAFKKETHQQLGEIKGAINKKILPLPESKNATTNAKIKIANSLMNEGKILSARKIYLEIKQEISDDEKELLWKLNSNIGKTYLNDFNESKASTYFEEAYRFYPEEEKGLFQLALSYLSVDDIENGIKVTDKILEINPDSIDAICIKSNLLVNCGKVSDALSLFSNRELNNFEICHAYGFALGKSRQFSNANEILFKALKYENSPIILDLIAINLLEPLIEELLIVKPININKKSSYYSKLLEALNYLNKSIESWSGQEVNKQLAIAHMNRGVIYTILKEIDKSLEDYRISERLGLNSDSLYRNLGICYIEKGEFKSASEYFVKAIEKGDLKSKEHYLNSLVFDRNFIKAKEIILENITSDLTDLNKDTLIYYIVLSEIYERELSDEKAANIIDEILKMFPDDLHVIIRATEYKRNKGAVFEAISLLNEKIKILDNKEVLRYYLADMHFENKEYKESASIFSDLYCNERYGSVEKMYLASLVNSGDFVKAIEVIDEIEKNTGIEIEELIKIRGNISLFFERFEDSKEIFKKLATNHRKSEYYIKWGLSVFRIGESLEAEKILLSAEKDFNNNHKELIRISSAFQLIGNYDKALKLAYEALSGLPNDIDANLNYFSVVIAHEQINPDLKLPDEFSLLFKESLSNFDKKFPGNNHLQKISVDENFSELKKVLLENENFYKDFFEIYNNNVLPVGITAKILKKNIYSVWSSLLSDPNKKIQAYDYQPMEMEFEFLTNSTEIIIDPVAFFTLYYLKRIDLLDSIFSKYFFPQKLLDSLFLEKNRLEISSKKGILTTYSVNGKLFVQEISPIEIEKELFTILDMINLIKNKTVGYEISSQTKIENEDILDNSLVQSIKYALDKNITILIDESLILKNFNEKYLLKGFTTQSLLKHAYERGLLNKTEYNRSIVKLILGYYYFISVNADLIVSNLRETNFKVSNNTQFLFKYLNQKDIDELSVANVLSEVFIILYNESITSIIQDAWIDTALDSIPKNNFNITVLLKFIYDRIEKNYRGVVEYRRLLNWIDGRMNSWAISRAVPYFK